MTDQQPVAQTPSVQQAEHKKCMSRVLEPWKQVIEKEFSGTESQALVLASMGCSSGQWQIAVPSLEKYSKSEVLGKWKKLLAGEDIAKIPKFEPTDIESCLAFDKDEDYIIVSSLRNSMSFTEMMETFGYVFKPFRSLDSIAQRIETIKTWSREEIEYFYNAYTHDLMVEEAFDLSTRVQGNEDAELLALCRCSYRKEEPIVPTKESEEEMMHLMDGIQGLPFSSSLKHVLAILRSEDHEYYMRREAILIGRGTADRDVDIDLTFETDRTCSHISRGQAILSFLDDCNFYLENIGNRVFRVNGVVIHPGRICRLKPGALLDFSGALLMFIPNERFVRDIKSDLGSNVIPPKKK